MMRIRATIILVSIGMALPSVSPAAATPLLIGDAAFAKEGGITSTPVGAAQFCGSHAGECGPDVPAAAHIELTEGLWAQMTSVNDEVNTRIAPETDQDLYGRDEYWTYPTTAGDCEDYALEKRRELLDRGFPASALLIAVVRRPDGDGHAVLMARTDRGDLILDNLVGTIVTWNRTPYQYVKRQSEFDAGRWVTIEDQRTLVAGS